VTLSIDIGYIRTLLTDGAAIHGLPLSPEQVDLARTALKRLGLVGKSQERERRPTGDELVALFEYFRPGDKTCFPLERIIKYAIASCMRLNEICTVGWPDQSSPAHLAHSRSERPSGEDRERPDHPPARRQRLRRVGNPYGATAVIGWKFQPEFFRTRAARSALPSTRRAMHSELKTSISTTFDTKERSLDFGNFARLRP
jgi:integrase